MHDLSPFIQEFIDEKFNGKVKTAFAYGSRVFKQADDKNKSKMIDLILIVQDEFQFHKFNLERNSGDYSFIKNLGPSNLTSLMHSLSSSILFNPYISYKNQIFKYGIVSEKNLDFDLSSWDYLYLAGRLQKPVIWFGKNNLKNRTLSNLESNLINAIQVSLIFLPPIFEEPLLFEKICELSYVGDFRCLFSIDSKKPSKIMRGNLEGFRELYRPFYSKIDNFHFSNGVIKQDNTFGSLVKRVKCLPRGFNNKILEGIDVNRIYGFNSGPEMISRNVLENLRKTVFRSSLSQSILSGLSSGGLKSLKYIIAKYSKL